MRRQWPRRFPDFPCRQSHHPYAVSRHARCASQGRVLRRPCAGFRSDVVWNSSPTCRRHPAAAQRRPDLRGRNALVRRCATARLICAQLSRLHDPGPLGPRPSARLQICCSRPKLHRRSAGQCQDQCQLSHIVLLGARRDETEQLREIQAVQRNARDLGPAAVRHDLKANNRHQWSNLQPLALQPHRDFGEPPSHPGVGCDPPLSETIRMPGEACLKAPACHRHNGPHP